MSRNEQNDMLKMYIEEINRHPLLTPEQELQLAMMKEEQSERGKLAKERLITSNLRLVIHIAEKFQIPNLPLLDRIQEGNIGLIKAVERFDYRKGCKLSTYAAVWIRYYIIRVIASKSYTIRVPMYMRGKIKEIEKAKNEIMLLEGHTPSIAELSAQMGIDEEEVVELFAYAQIPQSLDNLLTNDEGCVNDWMQDKTAIDPYIHYAELEMKSMFEDILSRLPQKEAMVLRYLYGFSKREPMTLEEIGQLPEFGVSKQRIGQIKEKALTRLYEEYGNYLKDFLD